MLTCAIYADITTFLRPAATTPRKRGGGEEEGMKRGLIFNILYSAGAEQGIIVQVGLEADLRKGRVDGWKDIDGRKEGRKEEKKRKEKKKKKQGRLDVTVLT